MSAAKKFALFSTLYTINRPHSMKLEKQSHLSAECFFYFFRCKFSIVFSQEMIEKPANFVEVVENRD